jgi:hypothetical protein
MLVALTPGALLLLLEPHPAMPIATTITPAIPAARAL